VGWLGLHLDRLLPPAAVSEVTPLAVCAASVPGRTQPGPPGAPAGPSRTLRLEERIMFKARHLTSAVPAVLLAAGCGSATRAAPHRAGNRRRTSGSPAAPPTANMLVWRRGGTIQLRPGRLS
jgi:hypothetical protein